MLLAITTTATPATDLGYLLHKHPNKAQTFNLKFGQVHVFYPQVSDERCTAVLLLDIDPIQLFRSRRASGNSSFALQQYVNDRPYVASSLLSVAIAEVYGTALSGRCKDRPHLVDAPLPLRAHVSALPSRGGADLLRRLFKPLGYQLTAQSIPLDEQFPDWGISDVYSVELTAEIPLKDLLAHLYVLIPVLDDDKHYYVGEDEIEKLLARGAGWLSQHPERDLIVDRYLRHRRRLTESALDRLVAEELPGLAEKDAEQDQCEEAVEGSIGLNRQRLERVLSSLRASGAKRVLDLGCGEGKLIRLLLPEAQFNEITGMDVAARSLELAEKRLQLDRLPDMQRQKLQLIQGSLLYRDARLTGYDGATLVEVIEHLEPARLEVMEQVVFGHARPNCVIVTTPNQEYNSQWPTLPAGQFRHPDHRFEWTRAEFQSWAERVAGQFGYTISIAPIGPEHPLVGAPTQMGVFIKQGAHS
jgi:3' terminal RNA ribose 2'-O-methyltransferase Hen1